MIGNYRPLLGPSPGRLPHHWPAVANKDYYTRVGIYIRSRRRRSNLQTRGKSCPTTCIETALSPVIWMFDLNTNSCQLCYGLWYTFTRCGWHTRTQYLPVINTRLFSWSRYSKQSWRRSVGITGASADWLRLFHQFEKLPRSRLDDGKIKSDAPGSAGGVRYVSGIKAISWPASGVSTKQPEIWLHRSKEDRQDKIFCTKMRTQQSPLPFPPEWSTRCCLWPEPDSKL